MATKAQMQKSFDDWKKLEGGVTVEHINLIVAAINILKADAEANRGCSKAAFRIIQDAC